MLSAEESNFSARLAIAQQMQEVCRYLHHSLVGIVTGIGNRRGDGRDDPNRPLEAAREPGRRLFEIRATDYQIDTDGSASVWEGGKPYPGYWRRGRRPSRFVPQNAAAERRASLLRPRSQQAFRAGR